MINTSNMHPEDFVSTIPAEACTELGADQDNGVERPMQMLSWCLLAVPVAAAVLALLI